MPIKVSNRLLGRTIGGVTGADLNGLSPLSRSPSCHQALRLQPSLCLTLHQGFGGARHAQVSHYNHINNINIYNKKLSLS